MTHLSLFMLGFTVVLIANFISLTKAERRLVPTVLFKEVTDIRNKWLSGEYEDKDHHYEVLLEALAWYKNGYDRQRRRLGEINRANLVASFAESQEQDIVNAEVSVDGIRRMAESGGESNVDDEDKLEIYSLKEDVKTLKLKVIYLLKEDSKIWKEIYSLKEDVKTLKLKVKELKPTVEIDGGGNSVLTSAVDQWTNDEFKAWVETNDPKVITPIGDDREIYFFVPRAKREEILDHWVKNKPKHLKIEQDYPYNADREKPSMFINGRHQNFPQSKKSFPRDYKTEDKTMEQLLPHYDGDQTKFDYYTDDGSGDPFNLWTVALAKNQDKFNKAEGEPALKWGRLYSDWTSATPSGYESATAREQYGFITFLQFHQGRTTKPMTSQQVKDLGQVKEQQYPNTDEKEVIAEEGFEPDLYKYDAYIHSPFSQKEQDFDIVRTYVIEGTAWRWGK